MPITSIILINYHTEELIITCLQSFYKYERDKNVEFIIVNNGGNLNELEKKIRNNPTVKIIEANENIGFSKGNNLGLQNAKGEYILFLNSDTLFIEPILVEMQKALQNRMIGIVGCQLRNVDKSLQLSYHEGDNVFNNLKWRNPIAIKFFNATQKKSLAQFRIKTAHKSQHNARWISGACMMLRKEDLLKNRWYWEEDFFMYWEDVELCYRVRRSGKKILYLPNIKIVHIGGSGDNNISINRFDIMEKSKLKYIDKTSGKWKRQLYVFIMRLELKLERFLERKKKRDDYQTIFEKEIQFYLEKKCWKA